MQLAFVTTPRSSLATEIEWAAGNGFSTVDLALEAPAAAPESVKWAEVKTALADNGRQAICRAATYLPLDNPAPLVRQAAMDETRRAIDATAAVGATLCTVRFCGWPTHLDERTGYEYYRQLFGVILKHGQAQGITVALETARRISTNSNTSVKSSSGCPISSWPITSVTATCRLCRV